MENEDRRLAWFPAPYLELVDGDDDDDDDELPPRGEIITRQLSYSMQERALATRLSHRQGWSHLTV